MLLIIWRSWQVRNNIVHESEKFSVEGSAKFLLRYWSELCDIRQQRQAFDSKGKGPVIDSLTKEGVRKVRVQERWKPPDEGWIKINVDGAFDNNTCQGGLGIIIRDHLGKVLLSAWFYLSSGRDAEEMEALACKEGLCLAAEWCNQPAMLSTDSSSVAGVLKARNVEHSHLKFILEEAVEAGDKLPSWDVSHSRRESNGAAHELAQLAKRTKHSAVWRFASPVCVEQIIARDCNHLSEQ